MSAKKRPVTKTKARRQLQRRSKSQRVASLSKLAVAIRREHAEVVSGVRHAKAAGEYLQQVKDRLKHGEFTTWVQTHVRFSQRTANVYMYIAEHWATIEPKLKDDPLLTMNEAVALVPSPGMVQVTSTKQMIPIPQVKVHTTVTNVRRVRYVPDPDVPRDAKPTPSPDYQIEPEPDEPSTTALLDSGTEPKPEPEATDDPVDEDGPVDEEEQETERLATNEAKRRDRDERKRLKELDEDREHLGDYSIAIGQLVDEANRVIAEIEAAVWANASAKLVNEARSLATWAGWFGILPKHLLSEEERRSDVETQAATV